MRLCKSVYLIAGKKYKLARLIGTAKTLTLINSQNHLDPDHAPIRLPRQRHTMKTLGIAGYSGSGKTTLIEQLLPRLHVAGLRVSVIKQSHHDIQVDVVGKDSWRHRQAGAHETLLSSPQRWMLVGELRGAEEPSLEQHLTRLSPCDLVLVEGYKHANLDKLEVWRAANARPWLHPDDARFIALAADDYTTTPKLERQAPTRLDLDQPATIAAFIVGWLRR